MRRRLRPIFCDSQDHTLLVLVFLAWSRPSSLTIHFFGYKRLGHAYSALQELLHNPLWIYSEWIHFPSYTVTVQYGQMPYIRSKEKYGLNHTNSVDHILLFCRGTGGLGFNFRSELRFLLFHQLIMFAFLLRICILVSHWKNVSHDISILKKWAKTTVYM